MLDYLQRLQALAQAGLTYATDPCDRERYEQLRAISVQMLAQLTDEPVEKIIRVPHAICEAGGYRGRHTRRLHAPVLLAIADDALGLIVLAVFYPSGTLSFASLGVLMTAAAMAALWLRRRQVQSSWSYLLGPGLLQRFFDV